MIRTPPSHVESARSYPSSTGPMVPAKSPIDRRKFLELVSTSFCVGLSSSWLLGAAANAFGCGRAAAADPTDGAGYSADDRLVSEIPAMATLVKQLNYVNESPKPDETCANCQLYTAGGSSRGTCKLFAQGEVLAEGWCTSWIKQPTSSDRR